MKRILTTLAQKWPEYLLEILVITIGILGAFALNNWNEGRKEQINEQILLTQLKEEYQSNLAQLDSKIESRNQLIKTSKRVLDYYDNPSVASLDSILFGLSNLALTVTYDPIKNDLTSSGNINLIRNQALKALLTRWSTDVIQVQEVEVIYLGRYNEHIMPYLMTLGVQRALDENFWANIQMLDFMISKDSIKFSDYGESRFLPTTTELLNDPTLEGMVSNSILMNEFINFEAIALRKQIVQILELLNEEIK